MSRRGSQDRLTQLVDALERAGVYGRGGAAFPTATKLRALAAQRGRPLIVVNAAEGEPLSQKDRYLLLSQPDSVLDGAHVAADALRADEIVFAIDEQIGHEADALRHACARHGGLRGRGIRATLQAVPTGYVTGQESALISALGGGAGKPTITPPYPFEKGLRGRPTLVSNVETYAHIGRVARNTYDGSRLLTVTGAVAQPGLVEITPRTTIAEVMQTVGGATEEIQGVLLGGYSGTWTTLADLNGLPLDERELRQRKLTLGAGVMFLLGDSHCSVAEVARVAAWMAAESAGQCGPCVHGLAAIAGALRELTLEGDRSSSHQRIRRWCAQVRRRGACAHPDGVARFVVTALGVFDAEFDDHARLGACDYCAASGALPVPARERRSGASGGTRRVPARERSAEEAFR